MEPKKSEFDKVLSMWDILVIAFGAMIGWGWVVSTGDWIDRGGVIGAMLGFVIGGVMIFFVGLTYAELTAAMPQCGGEHVFSHRAMGPWGSFVCTWAIIFGYVSVVCFEACALPTIIAYLYPPFLQGYLYTVDGFQIYATWLVTAMACAVVITALNIVGTKTAANLQTVLTVIIGAAGILLIVGSLFSGSPSNLEGQMFVGNTGGERFNAILRVALTTPFFFIGFDVIPQAAEEISGSLRKIGTMLILSIVLAVTFYALVIFAVGYVLNSSELAASVASASGLVTADAMAKAFHSTVMAKVVIVGGLCGIVTSWNSFLIGASRAMYSMAKSYMIPPMFGKLHPKHKTPVNALLLIGGISVLAPLLGRSMLVYAMDAGNFACCTAYCMVALSFIILRRKEPDMDRPYKIRNFKFVGVMAVIMSGAMVILYIIPNTGVTLVPIEWGILLAWCGLGVVFAIVCRHKYGADFGTLENILIENEGPSKEIHVTQAPKDVSVAIDMERIRSKELAASEAVVPEADRAFGFFLPISVQYGFGRTKDIGKLAAPFGKKALLVTGASSARKSGLYDRVREALEAEGITTALYDRARPNPLTTDAVDGAHFLKENGCDFVVALGGGSVIDCAKGIAFCAVNGDDIDEYIYGRKASDQALPIVAVPTTCGTGSEGNGFAVLTNPENGDKKSLRCASIAPKVAIVDPENMMTMPTKVLASVGYDALCHLMEAYTANSAEPLTDALCLYAMPLIVRNLPAACEDPTDKEAFGKLAIAATIGGMVIGQAGVTLAHAMEHPLSGLKNITHGRGLAVLSPYVIEETYRGNRYKFGNIARILGGMTAEDAAPLLRAFSDRLGLENSLKALGFAESDIPWLTENCQKVSAANLMNTPTKVDADMIARIYKKAM